MGKIRQFDAWVRGKIFMIVHSKAGPQLTNPVP